MHHSKIRIVKKDKKDNVKIVIFLKHMISIDTLNMQVYTLIH